MEKRLETKATFQLIKKIIYFIKIPEITIPAILIILIMIFPNKAHAIQIHSEPEGLYCHQLAHGFFAFSMTILMYWLRQMKLIHYRGWRYIWYAALFFILWNIDAMFAHYLEGTEGFGHTEKVDGWSGYIIIETDNPLIVILYYIAKLDHLFCVPAIIFWFFGLRSLLSEREHTTGSGFKV